MLLRQRAIAITQGTPVPNGVEAHVYLHADDSLFATVPSQDGWFTLLVNGNPGPHYLRLSYSGETHESSSKTTGASGATLVSLLPELFKVWTDGFIDDVGGELAVSAAGLGMEVTVADGFAVAQGILYDQYTPVVLPIQPATSQGRLDRVVLEVVPRGGGENLEGRARIVVVTGTPSSSPALPGLTQTTTLWQIPLATITVDASVSAIASNKVTNVATASGVEIQDGSITTPKLADVAVTTAKLALLAVDTGNIKDGAVTEPKLADNAVSNRTVANNAIGAPEITSGGLRSAANVKRVLAASTASDTPEWAELSLSHLADVGEEIPAENEVLTYYQGGYRPRPAASGGTAYGGRQANRKDANFGAIGNLGGTQNLATASELLPAGQWFLESEVHLTARGTGGGTFTVRLLGNGTPQGADASSRIFETTGFSAREIVLSGGVVVTLGAPTTISATAQVQYNGGNVSDIRDGVVILRWFPR